MSPLQYYFATGLKELTSTFHGNEHIHAGMRPYGLHLGNKLPLIVYPILIGNALRKRGIEPRIQYTVSLNDWDTDEYSYPEDYPMNLIPKGRSFQYKEDRDGCHKNCVDHWETIVERELDAVRQAMPEADVKIIRVSTLKENSDFSTVLRFGLEHPKSIGSIVERTLDKKVLESPLQFAGAVCKSCFSIEGETEYNKEKGHVLFNCSVCSNKQETDILEQDYWMYVHLVGAAKNGALRPDAWIFGGDFIESGSVKFHTAVYEEALQGQLNQAHLFTPVLLGPDSRKMSKSLGNLAETPLEELIEKAESWDDPEITIDFA